MADEDRVQGDEPIGRMEAFERVHGISRTFYSQAIEATLTHALARHAAAPDANRVPWTGLGARNIGGRVRALAQNPQQPAVWYAGTAQGGVFRSIDNGDTWAPIGQPADAIPVGALAVAPSSPNIVYIGSGEMSVRHVSDPTGSFLIATEEFAAGRGFFRCDTAAASPALVREVASAASAPGAAAAANSFARIVVDPHDSDRCWMATPTGLWRREAGPRFFNENPTAAAHPAPAPVAPTQGASVSDVILVPHADAQHPRRYRLFAAVASVGIFRGVFDADHAGQGVTWDPMLADASLPVPSTLATPTWDRIRLGFCAGQTSHIYAIAEDPVNDAVLGVWHSRNGGNSWDTKAAPSLGGQVWVNLYVEVHPDNPALIVAGGVDLARSDDFGATWQLIIDWRNFNDFDRAQHGDQHTAVFDVADPRRLWVANDGGISMTPDIVNTNPRVVGGWRRRSHGLVGAQFNDIATHPSYPFMLGGGLQDNGAYVSFGGETWYLILDGDGGQMAFEVNDPRTFYAPNQARNARSVVVRPDAVTAAPGIGLVIRRAGNADLAPPNDIFAVSRSSLETAAMTATRPLFIGMVEHHRRTASHLLIGRGFRPATVTEGPTTADVFFTTDGMATFGPSNLPLLLNAAGNPVIGTDDVSALAYGNGAPGATDWWVGTSRGQLFRRPNAGANPTTWISVALPAAAAGLLISRIAVHPDDERYVACSAVARNPPQQGRVYLTLDRGANWAEITGLAAVGAPAVTDPPRLELPPSPVTSLAFDPQPAASAAQVLFAGTLAGVYVIRNLPRRRSPAAAGAVPAFNPRWQFFGGLVSGPPPAGLLPMSLVKDIRIQSLPRDSAAADDQPESVARHRLIAAMYGRGIYVADITGGYPAAVGGGGPVHRLYLRQTVIEDGLRYPRPTPATLNTAPAAGGSQPKLGGDPRLPVNAVLFSDRDAYDIRVDNAPFQFFEDRIDGVEFDEDLRHKNLRPGEPNRIYVQVHTRGHRRCAVVDVDLYFAAAALPGAVNAAPQPALQADFWDHWTAQTLPGPGPWQRVDGRRTLFRVAPNQPEVARFDWTPPASLSGAHVSLLALVHGIGDEMPAGLPTNLGQLVRNERRAAVRTVAADRFVPDFYIRDGIDDDGRPGGAAFGGRSPDIIVVPAAEDDPATAFADLGDDRSGDRVRGSGGTNVIYVRTHNRRAAAANVSVELFWTVPNPVPAAAAADSGRPFDASRWQAVTAVAAVNVQVPASGVAYASFQFDNAPAPAAGLPDAIAFIALLRAQDGGDPLPTRVGVTTPAVFWRLFTERANADNAALRAVRYAA